MAETIEQFCILAKTAKGRACTALIQQVLTDKRVFVFGELLALPSVQELAGTEYQPYLHALELFAYGKYREYLAAPESFPDMNEARQTKLRMLTIVQLSQEQKVIPYDLLQYELGIGNVRVLEDLIIDTIYAGLIRGKLDQRAAVFRVKSTIGRDVRLNHLDYMIDKLAAWHRNCSTLIDTIDAYTSVNLQERQSDEVVQKQLQADVDVIKQSIKEQIVQGELHLADDFEHDRQRAGRPKRNRGVMSSLQSGGDGRSRNI